MSEKRKVKCLETNIVYDSITQAAEGTGFKRKSINNITSKPNKSLHKYHFVYTYEDVNYNNIPLDLNTIDPKDVLEYIKKQNAGTVNTVNTTNTVNTANTVKKTSTASINNISDNKESVNNTETAKTEKTENNSKRHLITNSLQLPICRVDDIVAKIGDEFIVKKEDEYQYYDGTEYRSIKCGINDKFIVIRIDKKFPYTIAYTYIPYITYTSKIKSDKKQKTSITKNSKSKLVVSDNVLKLIKQIIIKYEILKEPIVLNKDKNIEKVNNTEIVNTLNEQNNNLKQHNKTISNKKSHKYNNHYETDTTNITGRDIYSPNVKYCDLTQQEKDIIFNDWLKERHITKEDFYNEIHK